MEDKERDLAKLAAKVDCKRALHAGKDDPVYSAIAAVLPDRGKGCGGHMQRFHGSGPKRGSSVNSASADDALQATTCGTDCSVNL